MSSYFSFRRAPPAPLEEAPFGAPSAAELPALAALEATVSAELFSPTATVLHGSDPWHALPAAHRRALLLRFLRFHLLAVAPALHHIRRVAAWRAADHPWLRPAKLMRGPAAALPVLQARARGRDGEALLYSPARAYVKKDADHALQEHAIKTLFEHLLYVQPAEGALSAVAVLDFCDMSMSNVDLVATRNGIRVFADYYPDLFKKVLIVNYAKWLYGTWKCIAPLLDARTVRKVMFLSDANEMREELSKSFDKSEIPQWLGGDAEDGPLHLHTGSVIDADEIARTMQVKGS